MFNPYDIVYSVLITEKATKLADDSKGLPKYTFKVNPSATKINIRKAVEAIFDNVKVAAVNTMNYEGKFKRMRTSVGKRSDWKKAVVTLKEGKIETL